MTAPSDGYTGQSATKELLRRLLEAERLGREAAAGMEALGEECLRKAEVERGEILRQMRSDMERQLAQLKEQAQREIEGGCREIVESTDATIERLQAQTAERRSAAVARIVGLLLGESEGFPVEM